MNLTTKTNLRHVGFKTRLVGVLERYCRDHNLRHELGSVLNLTPRELSRLNNCGAITVVEWGEWLHRFKAEQVLERVSGCACGACGP